MMADAPRSVCLLHAGMHKTGSSSIQRALAGSSSEHFHYLDLGLGSPNHSAPLHAGFSSTPEDYHAFKRRCLTSEQVSRMGETVRRAMRAGLEKQSRLKIISGEDMTALDVPALERLRDFVSESVDSTRVFAYARSPASFMDSAFQQRVRGGLSRYNLAALYPHYRRRFENLEAVFGADNVTLLPYIPSRFPGGDVVADFCLRAGDVQPTTASPARLNVAFSGRAVAMLYTYRRFGRARGVGPTEMFSNRALVWALGQLVGPKLMFDRAVVKPVLARQKSDLDWLAQRIQEPLEADRAASGFVVSDESDLFTLDDEQRAWLRWYLPQAELAGSAPEDTAAAIDQALPRIVSEYRSCGETGHAAG